ncbi:MAG: hypothetical protein KKG47_08010 [Proteobacteria bacterium]|nr:hypothetical protein [Pseudomonadota bacterium]MBU1738243.1 hypothetical protein [Pseudomonadota bacterium]
MVSIIQSSELKCVRRVFALLAVFALMLVSHSYGAKDDLIPVRLITVITIDDQGAPISFPHELAYDPVNRETYLVSATGRVTIYNHKYFPVSSFGRGRGVHAPQGVAVDGKGYIYVCQGDTNIGSALTPRLTIFDPAFFVSREIVFSRIPELKDFIARRIAVSNEGLIYLVGFREREAYLDRSGAAVLSAEGEFLRWIKPMDRVFRPVEQMPPPAGKDDLPPAGEDAAEGAVEDLQPDLPAGLRPGLSERDRDDEEETDREVPVYLFDVVIDPNGRIYLLSSEVSRIYVYNAKEEFLFKFGEKGGVARKLSNPLSLAVDYPRRTIYVLDYMRHTALAYEYETGKYIFEFGGRGLDPLWFNFPNHIEVDDEGRVLVSDLFNRRVQVIDPNMQARRPLAGLVSPELASGSLPAPVEKASPPEVTVAEPAKPVAPAPVIAAAGPPGAVVAPEIPGLLAGINPIPDTSLPPAHQVPPRPLPVAPKQLVPRKFKSPVVAIWPPVAPEMIQEPVVVAAVPEQEAVVSTVEAEPLQRVLRLPASLGVYGPIAALGLLGGWFLYRNR